MTLKSVTEKCMDYFSVFFFNLHCFGKNNQEDLSYYILMKITA